jgi:hypothetical protein|tara:strand:+ start:87 stop:311 length:225 start_codon:yes stop_codon:yes gene_type:complete
MKKSLRPKNRPKDVGEKARLDAEGSTQHPSGDNIYEQGAKPSKKKAEKKVKKMASGGMCRGMGAATRGGNFVKG